MARPLLDVSDVLTDPDFCDTTLICQRNALGTTEQGMGEITTTNLAFSGVVTSDKGQVLLRNAVGEHVNDTIMVITRFALRNAGTGATADIVLWNGRQYTVVNVNDYSTYGIGFVEAICELIPLAG